MRAALRAFGLGALVGLGWGVAGRGFMRLLAPYPEFSWSGTLAIVVTAAVVGGLVALVRSARLRGRGRWWRFVGLPFLVLFVGPGAVLFPGVVGVVMLLDRRRWLAVPGLGLVGVTLWWALDSLGGTVSARQWVGMAVLACCVGVLGWAARELVRRWRPGVEGSGRPPSAAGGSSPEAARVKVVGEAGQRRSYAP